MLDLTARGVGEEGAQRALPVDALVLGESPVLDGDDRQFHLIGDLIARDFESALLVQPGDGIARRVDHRGHGRHRSLDEFGRHIVDGVRRAVGGVAEPACQRKHHSGQQRTRKCGTSGELRHGFSN